jgi:16S rRNA C1402 N4-methylase RsmH
MVKRTLAAGATDRAPRGLPVVPDELRPELSLLTRGAERPGPDEVALNPRAASARLRAAVKLDRSTTGDGSTTGSKGMGPVGTGMGAGT